MGDNVVNCCLVGYGGIAMFHAKALRGIEGARLHTVVGRRPEPTEAFREEMGFERGMIDYDAAMADPEIDAVIVASPNELHYEMADKALRAGKDVFVEIPLAMSQKGAELLVERVDETGRKLMVGHTRRFSPVGRFVKAFLASEEAGRVHQHHVYSFWFRHENVGWTAYRRSWVDDVLFHHTCHHVDSALWTLDAEVRRVRGELSPLDPRTGTSLDVSLILRTTEEQIVTISQSYNARPGAGGSLYICDNGTLILSGGKATFGGEVVFQDEGKVRPRGVDAQDAEFIAAIREDREPSCTVRDGLKALTVLQQVYDQMVELDGEDKYRRRWGL